MRPGVAHWFHGVVEPLTAVVLLAGRYGVQQLVGALTGRADLGGLAAEMFGALSASEDRLSNRLSVIEQRLGGIEERLDQILDQRFTSAIGAGLRCLVDAGGNSDASRRQDDLLQARDQFRRASGAATSSLQRATAERYLMLCGLALDRPDVARTAWAQLNGAATAAALELRDAPLNAPQVSIQPVDQMSERQLRKQPPDFHDRLARRKAILDGVPQAATIVENLLAESGVVGRALGEVPSRPIRRNPKFTNGSTQRELSDLRWVVDHNGTDRVRIGAIIVTWEVLDIRPVRRAVGGTAFYPERLWDGGRIPTAHEKPSHVVDVRVRANVEISPPLSRAITVSVGTSVLARDTPSSRPNAWSFPAGQGTGAISATVTLPADKDGTLTENVEIRAGAFVVIRPTGGTTPVRALDTSTAAGTTKSPAEFRRRLDELRALTERLQRGGDGR